jgi:O-antigen/teichoic acid export membrane protein
VRLPLDTVQLWQRARRRLNNRAVWRASGLLLTSSVLVALLGAVRIPILTRMLSKDEVGMIGVAASILPFLQLLSLSGLDSATYHYTAKGHPAALQVNVATRLRWSLVSTLGFFLAGMYWHWRGNQALAWLLAIAGLTYPLTTGLSAGAGVLGAREDFGRLFWYRLGEAVTRYAGFSLLLILPWLPERVLWFYLLNNLALAALQIETTRWLVSQARREGTSPMMGEAKQEMVRYGKHLTLVNAISTAQTRADSLLVGWLLPLSVMADYSIAMLAYAQFKRLWSVYYSVRYPPVVRLPLARRRRRMIFETGVVWAGFAGLGLAAALGLWVLVPIILPPEYRTSLPIINWLLATFVISVPGFFAEMYFRTQQDERSQYVLRGVAAVCGIILPLVFILLWGVRGVVVGRFAASLIFSAVGLWLFLRDGK